MLPCRGLGVEPLHKTTASWLHNNKVLDLSKMEGNVSFVKPNNSTYNADLRVNLEVK